MTHRSKAWVAAWAIGLVAITPLAHAQDAEQRRRPMQERRNEGGIPPWQRGEFARGNAPATEPVNEAAIRDFMKQYSPKRWEKYESDIPDEHKDRIYRAMSMKFMQLERMKKDEPDLYAILIKRLPIEDDIFSLGLELSRGTAKNREETRAKLEQGVRALLTNRIEERRARLKMWQQRVEAESAKLKSDEASLEREIDSTVSAIESTSKWPAMEGKLLPLPRERRQKDRPTTNPSTASAKISDSQP